MVKYYGNFMVTKAKDDVTYEEIRDIVWRRHTAPPFGDSDTM